ncbi:Phage terminase large subunit [Rhodovulum sp. PH10]|nr:Phage terminase large subunit [Rhodovulum sp. PH10]
MFVPLLEPARYKGAHGGRGSGKSHFFAEMLIEDALSERGLLSVCIREVQKTLADSAKRLIEAKLKEHRLGEADGFKVWRERIETPGDGAIIFQGMADHTAESIKSLEGFRRAWIEEAQSLSARSLTLLRPTIRAEGSEIWASWNPRRKGDPIDLLLRGAPPTGAAVVQANWRDNPWFPSVLDQERRDCMRDFPDDYDHIWEGGYATATTGAYFSKHLADAKAEGRIGKVAPDPIVQRRAFWDIGGAGASADAMSIWVAQFVDREIRVLDYIEGVGQVLSYYVNELRTRGHGSALCVLPHDGVATNSITGKRYEDHVRDAGFEALVIPNQGRGAAMMRVQAARRLFPRIWFNAETTEAGREALAFYHERRDEDRAIGLGPEHDWSSHAADAFGLMAIAYEQPMQKTERRSPRRAGGGWMGA